MSDATLQEIEADFAERTGGARYGPPTHGETVLETVLDRLEADRNALVEATVAETGIPIEHVEEEFYAAIEGVRHLPEIFDRHRQRLKVLGDAYGVEYASAPKGRVLVYAPWNSPLLAQIFLPCLSYYAGNRTVLKPSSRANTVSEIVVNALEDARDADDVRTRRLTASGKAVSEAMTTEWIEYAYYMGSRDVGAEIRSAFDGEFFGEYEGNNVALLDDVSERAIDRVMASVVEKNGIDCDNLRGVFVPESAFDEAVSRLQSRAADLTIGDPLDHGTDVSEVLGDGLSVVPDPTAERMSTPEMGPEIWVHPCPNGLVPAVRSFFADSEFGLSTLVLSDNPESYVEFLREETPTTRICVNESLMEFVPHAPWGGRGHTSDGGVRPWVEKFSDTVVVERGDRP
jgi:acyl-CoA reductase-like NAD-dependent aldehyde dehydrogenase